MMFRGVSNAYIYGANTFGKVLHSVISLCVVSFISGTYAFTSSLLNNWALALSESGEELNGSLQNFVDGMGATQYTTPGLIPADPVGIVFVLAILVGLIGGMWTAPGPKE
jgi:ABC-type antimicrobial peptide transport system permease subunit